MLVEHYTLNLNFEFLKIQFIPLEIDHIDGNSENNSEENLRLICPNCHSLTATYKGANRGKGRNITWILKERSASEEIQNVEEG